MIVGMLGRRKLPPTEVSRDQSIIHSALVSENKKLGQFCLLTLLTVDTRVSRVIALTDRALHNPSFSKLGLLVCGDWRLRERELTRPLISQSDISRLLGTT